MNSKTLEKTSIKKSSSFDSLISNSEYDISQELSSSEFSINTLSTSKKIIKNNNNKIEIKIDPNLEKNLKIEISDFITVTLNKN